ncbi:MAG: SDR family NAD(P)-dependent oxidoreductase [Candidatus Binatia bacterium]
MRALDEKVAIVTGGAGGIGAAIAQSFSREGARVAIVDIDASAAEHCAHRIAVDENAMPHVADVTKKQAVSELVTAILSRWRRVDILVNVAGGAEREVVIDMSAADWDRVVDMNLKSVFLCCQAVLPAMVKQHYGKIVNISSIYGFTGNATRSSYAAAKAGVAAFTKSLALEHVQDGLNINAIAPGRIETLRVRGHYSDEAWAAEVAKIPMGRPGTPEEIASTALFLVLDENKYITGQTIHVNGAWLNH